MPKTSSPEASERRWARHLLTALVADGWAVQSEVQVPGPASSHHIDVLACKGPLTYVIEVKGARDGRSATLTSLAAQGLLQARKFASTIPGIPMVVVGAPRLSPSLIQAIRQFLAEFGDGASWGVVDESGLLELHGPGLADMRARASPPRPRAPREAASRVLHGRADLFSDLSQWCLKLLLSHLLPAKVQLIAHGLPVAQPLRNASELAKIARVSTPTAWRTVRTLQEDSLLLRSEPLEILRTEVLMSRWQATNSRQRTDIRARWLFPSRTGALERLSDVLRVPRARADETARPRQALGLFAAAELHGHGYVRGVAPHLLHEDPSPGALERLGLTMASPGERVDVFVRKPRFLEAVFRGVTSIHGVPVADILQIWLDVATHPARGEEMARHLATQVLSRIFPFDEAEETS